MKHWNRVRMTKAILVRCITMLVMTALVGAAFEGMMWVFYQLSPASDKTAREFSVLFQLVPWLFLAAWLVSCIFGTQYMLTHKDKVFPEPPD